MNIDELKVVSIVNAAQIIILYILAALGWGFSIEYFKISVNASNYLFGAFAILGTIALAIWHAEKHRKFILKKIKIYTADDNIESKLNLTKKPNP
jgi:fumarate reductase subunit D